MSSLTMNNKLVLSALIVALQVLILVPGTRQALFEKHVMQVVDTRSIAYVDQSLKNAGAAFLLARGFNAVARGDLKPPRGTSFPLDRFRDAMALAASRDGLGKTTVEIQD